MNVPPGLGELGACPHCGGLTRLEPSPTLRWVCGACGGARVPGLEPQALAGDLGIVRSLAAAKRARDGRAILRGVSFVFAAMAVLSLLPIAIMMRVAPIGGVVVVAASLLIAAMAVGLRIGAARSRRAMEAALDDAWSGAAALIARGKAAITAADLARVMRVDGAIAERLLSRLSAESRARVDVGDDAELLYRIEGERAEAEHEANEANEARAAKERRV